MVSLKFDACHISDRVSFNFHTGEMVGFREDAFDIDILASELKLIESVNNADKNDLSDYRTKQYLLFMISCWENNEQCTKRVMA